MQPTPVKRLRMSREVYSERRKACFGASYCHLLCHIPVLAARQQDPMSITKDPMSITRHHSNTTVGIHPIG